MLTLREVCKSFGRRQVLREVSLQVHRGEVVGLVGPNGAGKTTLLRIAVGLLDADRGAASIAGLALARARVAAQGLVGYLPEQVPCPRELTVESYLLHRAGIKGLGARRQGAVQRALALAELAEVRRQVIGTLSKGFRQRVGLADAVLADPPLLVLDEPSSGLDPMAARRLRDRLREAAGERAVLLSSHALGELEAMADRVAVMFDGQVVAEGTPAALCQAQGRRSLDEAVLAVLEQAAGERAESEGAR
ncbi:MAG TPA: ABC transporter ATP-binding protein [Kofleriaceae bacterium]|nr:ABC transporter ATP-binding protein [Kofleriaceae bacterium]